MDTDARKKIQIFLLLALVIAGARAAYIVYERHQERKADVQPKKVVALKADYYVTPKKLHPYDLNSARELTKQPVWVKLGYSTFYYPYDAARHKTDFDHPAGLLGPLQKLQITDVISELPPHGKPMQVLVRFDWEGKPYVSPIGAGLAGDYKIYSDDMLFIEDPHELYKHWPADVWKSVDAHEIKPGMSELQASFARGLGVPQGSGDYGSRTLFFANGGPPVTVRFSGDKAVEIVPAK